MVHMVFSFFLLLLTSTIVSVKIHICLTLHKLCFYFYYALRKEFIMKKKSTVLVLITVICLIATVVLWFAMNRTAVEYTEVKAKVLSSETKTRKIKKTGTRQTYYEVSVEYDGKTYDLKNVHNGYSVGRDETVYLSKGNLYADVAGVKTSTPVATVYFVFLFGTFAMIFVSASSLSKDKANKKKEIQA